MKKDNLFILIATIGFFVGITSVATFALVNPSVTLANLNINTTVSQGAVFTTSGGSKLNMTITQEAMDPSNASNQVASGADNLVITLTSDGKKAVCCNYNLKWAWDSSSYQYNLTTGASNEYVVAGSLTGKYKNASNVDTAYTNDNTSFSKQVPNYNTSAQTIISDTICNNVPSLSTSVTHTWNLRTTFYNLNIAQDHLKGKNLLGKIIVADVVCSKK